MRELPYLCSRVFTWKMAVKMEVKVCIQNCYILALHMLAGCSPVDILVAFCCGLFK